MKPTTKFVHVYLVPLAIVAGLFVALRWIPVQMTLEWLVPLAAEYMPASIPPLHIILFLGLSVGGLFALAILTMTRYLQRRVIYRQRLRTLEDKRKLGHDSIAASVFDPASITLAEDDDESTVEQTMCELEQDPRLAMLIATLWAKPEFHNFLQRLFDADAGEGRMLSPGIRQELAFLRNLYLEQNNVYARPARTVTPMRRSAAAGEHLRGVAV